MLLLLTVNLMVYLLFTDRWPTSCDSDSRLTYLGDFVRNTGAVAANIRQVPYQPLFFTVRTNLHYVPSLNKTIHSKSRLSFCWLIVVCFALIKSSVHNQCSKLMTKTD